MFIITESKNKTINWPVTVETAADGGKIAKFTFTGTFKVLDDDQREAIAAGEQLDGEGGDGSAWKDAAVDRIMQVMTGWGGVVDQNRTAIEFNRENLRAAVRSANGVAILRAINTAIGEITTGARAKN